MSPEALYGQVWQKMARREGHRPALPRADRDNRPKTRKRRAGPETVAMMRVLTERQASTWDLAEAVGIDADAASWRLRSLQRAEVVEVVGKTTGLRHRPNHIWTLGPNAAAWLARYEGTV